MKRFIARAALSAAVVLLATGCSAGEPKTVQTAGAWASAGSSSTTTTTWAPSTTTTTPLAPPTIALTCPENYVGSYEWVRFDFGYDFRYFADPMKLRIDYGDGDSHTSTNEADAKANAFWHKYTVSGAYHVEASITDGLGRTVTASCSFSWTAPPTTTTTLRQETVASGGSYGGGSSGGSTGGSKVSGCYYKGQPLWGKVKIVDYFADIKVQVVDYFPDLKVQRVDYFPTSCGKWELVDSFPDFTIQVVDYFADIKIQFVDYFPGM